MTDAPRTCADCPADMSARHATAERCAPCVVSRENARQRRYRAANPKKMQEARRLYYVANLEKVQRTGGPP